MRIFIWVFILGFCLPLQAQQQYNQLSLDLKYGASIPLSPVESISKTEYISFKNFQVGGRYMLNQKFGLSGTYTYQGYGNQNAGLSFHRLSLEGVASLSHILNFPYYIKEYINLQVHAGTGISIASPNNTSNYDRMGNLLLGGSLLFNISPHLALVGDLTYSYQIGQWYGYDGEVLDIQGNSENGANLFVGIGVYIYLGKEKYHADWY